MAADNYPYSFNASLVDLGATRNAWPSFHITWALLTFWICRDLRRGRWVAGAFLICTIVSTMALGERYLVDVIAAFPLSLMVWQVCVGEGTIGNPRRMLPVMAGGLILLLWLVGLRSAPRIFWLSPVIPWAASIATVGCSLFAVSRHPDQRPVPSLDSVHSLIREQQSDLIGVG